LQCVDEWIVDRRRIALLDSIGLHRTDWQVSYLAMHQHVISSSSTVNTSVFQHLMCLSSHCSHFVRHLYLRLFFASFSTVLCTVSAVH